MKPVNGSVDGCLGESVPSTTEQWLTNGRTTLIRLDILPPAISKVRPVAFTPITTQISATRSAQLQWRLLHMSSVLPTSNILLDAEYSKKEKCPRCCCF